VEVEVDPTGEICRIHVSALPSHHQVVRVEDDLYRRDMIAKHVIKNRWRSAKGIGLEGVLSRSEQGYIGICM